MDRKLNKIIELHEIELGKDIYGKFYKLLSELVGIGCTQPTIARVSILAFTLAMYGTAFGFVLLSTIESWGQDYSSVVENSIFLLLDVCFVTCYSLQYTNVPRIRRMNFEATKLWESISDEKEKKLFSQYFRIGCLAGTGGAGKITPNSSYPFLCYCLGFNQAMRYKTNTPS
ncbi:hypothetical protein QAD02_019727 [Eretmocerus hayati]|uniref:Uncharacterized protein n=1 Tax=Eretmocerus hayati TaxID=131215 RepID=A0ACC2PK30_9HYME|nr:hypothetical protein QAD02_019727 [Eretmocerus hayati]